MKNLFFDVETTGLVPRGAREEDWAFMPRVVQIAALLVDGEKELASFSCLVRPSGFEIPAEASAIHGITTAAALADGLDAETVLTVFMNLAQRADGFVAHNIAFDRVVVGAEFIREDFDSPFVPGKPLYCTMQAATEVCRLPGRYGKYKWPKLAEVYRIAFCEELTGAHDALADIRATARVYQWLMSDGWKAAAAKQTDSIPSTIAEYPVAQYS